MRVLIVNTSLHPVGGTEVYVRNSISALASKGHLPLVISADSGAPQALVGLHDWASLPGLFTTSLRPAAFQRARQGVKALGELLHRWRPEVAFLHLFDAPLGFRAIASTLPTVRFVHTAWPYCPAGTRWLPRSDRECLERPGLGCLRVDRKERCLITTRGERYGLTNSLRRVLDLSLQRDMLRRSSLVVAYTDYLASQLRAAGAPADRLLVVPPGVPPKAVPARRPTPGRLLFAGRLVDFKGPADALRVVAAVPGATLTLAGDGPARKGLERLAGELRIIDRVHFSGWLDQGAVDAKMQEAEVILFPSHWPEIFGLVGVQAAWNGRPVVAYDVGGVRSWLSERTGILVPPGDVAELAKATSDLLRDPRRARTLGVGARAAAARFSMMAFSQRLDEVLHQALHNYRVGKSGVRIKEHHPG